MGSQVPRPNPGRVIGAEETFADRVRIERERRGWSYEATAQALTDAGCPVQSSAIYKIEKAENRRRITLDEAVAFARVFGASLDELLRPVDEARADRIRELIEQFTEVRIRSSVAAEELQTVSDALRAWFDDDLDELRVALERAGVRGPVALPRRHGAALDMVVPGEDR